MRRTLLVGFVTGLLVVSGTVEAAGAPDTGFGTNGVVVADLLDRVGPVDVDSAGRSVVLGVKSGNIAIARYTANGSPDTSFSGDGRADVAIPVVTAELLDVRVLADGSIVAIGRRTTVPMDPFSNGLWSAKVTSSGAPAAGYGTTGVSTFAQGYLAYAEHGSVGADGSAVITQRQLGTDSAVTISSAGVFGGESALEFDSSAFPPACVFMAGTRQYASARVSSSAFVHVSTVYPFNCGIDEDVVVVTRQTDAGAAVWTEVIDPPEMFSDEALGNAVSVVGSDVVVATNDGATSSLHRFAAATGTPVASWGTGGRATVATGFGDIGGIAELADGKVGIVNAAALSSSPTSVVVERLASNGTRDASFGRVTVPVGGELTGTAVAGAPDGGVHVTTQRAGQGALRRFVADGGAPGPGADVVTVEPGRLLDTRTTGSTVDGQFLGAGKLPAGQTIKVKIAGRGGVAADAVGVELNITAIQNEGRGFATLYPCTATPPVASSLNYTPGVNIANATTVALNANGEVCIFTNVTAHYALDVLAYVPAGSAVATVEPGRLLDTRTTGSTVDGQFLGAGKLPAGQTIKVKIAGRGGVAADAVGVELNITAIQNEGRGFATLYPCTATPPVASSLNYTPGVNIANATTVALNANGEVCIFTNVTAHYALDVLAYVPAGSAVATVEPGRLLDTRPTGSTVDGQFLGAGKLPAGQTIKVKIAGRGGVAADAVGVELNITAIQNEGRGFATLYPCTATPPVASSLNYTPGVNIANATTVALNANGEVCIFTNVTAHYALDVLAYVAG